jgi:predicted pyridoxine 5'-phosphate oxidase superfamily flavin-nucleotide-binding protein
MEKMLPILILSEVPPSLRQALANQGSVYIATASKDGTPNLDLGPFGILDDERIVIPNVFLANTLTNLEETGTSETSILCYNPETRMFFQLNGSVDDVKVTVIKIQEVRSFEFVSEQVV